MSNSIVDIVKTDTSMWPAVETLVKANMASADPAHRYAAQATLASIAQGPLEIARPAYYLMQAGLHDPQPVVQQSALMAIGQMARAHPGMIPSIFHDVKQTIGSPHRDVALTSLQVCKAASEEAPHLASLFVLHAETASQSSDIYVQREANGMLNRLVSPLSLASPPEDTTAYGPVQGARPMHPVRLQTPMGVTEGFAATTGTAPKRSVVAQPPRQQGAKPV